MKFFLLLAILFQFSAFAQDAVIAVGQAEQDKDKLVIDDAELKAMSVSQKKLAGDLLELIRNDFVFYKHKFNAVDYSEKGQDSYSKPALEKWTEKGVTYFVASSIGGSGSDISFAVKVWSVSAKRNILSQSFTVSQSGLRSQGHRISDAIYRSMTGKPSIFNAKIAFVSDRTSRSKDTEKELYIMDFDGRRVEKLTNFNSVVIGPSVSPDNSKLMFSLIATHRDVSRGKVRMIKNIDLMTYDFVTKKVSTISSKPGINSGAIWSANGNAVFLTLTYGGNADIYEMTLGSQRLRKITSNYAEDVDPSVTQDGTLMTFLSSRAGKAHIYTMDPRETEKDIKRISFVGQFNATPRFSPEGKEIVFTSWVDNGFDLYRIDSLGNNLSRLTKDFGSNEDPNFSPDGEFIVFTSKRILSRTKAVQDIYIMNREGEVLGQLTQDFGRCFSPVWTNNPK